LKTWQTLKAAWPLLKGALLRGQVFRPHCELTPPDADVDAHYDMSVPLTDGTVLTANVFASRTRRQAGMRDPVVMCAHPYDNRLLPALGNTPLGGPPLQYRLLPQSGGRPAFSTLTSWESPDPSFWVPAGYTVVNLNLPGFANSGGPATIMSDNQGAAVREAIAWVGAQDWCDGNVGLNGVSFLCISQYLAAAPRDGGRVPEALKCIIPWEGLSDIYRDIACRGGIPDRGFLNFWWHTEIKETLNVPIDQFLEAEEGIPPDILDLHPTYDAYWRAKVPALENISVPMLQCASFSDHELHSFGSFRAYETAQSTQKWLYTHRSGKWTEYYKPDCLALQRAFMDHFLKGEPTQFPDLPSARIEVRSDRDTVAEVRWEATWPPRRTEYKALHLSADGRLAPDGPDARVELSYEAKRGRVAFDLIFEEDTEITGYAALRLWVEARGGNGPAPKDMMICCFLEKLDAERRPVRFYGTAGLDQDVVSRGYGRAARRALDPEMSTPFHPVPMNDTDMWLSPGEIVPLDIAFCPSATLFYAGETLRLIIAGHDLVHGPIFSKDTSSNTGRHVLHLGGEYDAHLLLPVVPRKANES